MTDRPAEVMNIDELSRYLRISGSTLYKLARAGCVPGQKIGRHWRFRKAAIDRWLDEKRGRSRR
jgi:excisionase family DNA binding protein